MRTFSENNALQISKIKVRPRPGLSHAAVYDRAYIVEKLGGLKRKYDCCQEDSPQWSSTLQKYVGR
jgi:hypothetical protein